MAHCHILHCETLRAVLETRAGIREFPERSRRCIPGMIPRGEDYLENWL